MNKCLHTQQIAAKWEEREGREEGKGVKKVQGREGGKEKRIYCLNMERGVV